MNPPHSPDIVTPDWVKDAVFYQIFPDRFARSSKVPKSSNLQAWGAEPHPQEYQGGDLLGVVERLDYLSELGVSALYFCPVFQSACNHRYHTHDYYKVDPMLGGNAALTELLEQAHARGMKVILDGVFNHASRGFFQFSDLLENGPHSAYTDWFHVQDYPLRPYHGAEFDSNYLGWWGNRALPKFNTDTPAVREYLWSVGEYWIRQGVDGWRLDVPNEIDDDVFWQEFRRRVKTANPEAYIVGEIWEDATRWLRGDQFDAVMNYPFTRPTIGYFGASSLQPGTFLETGYKRIPPLSSLEFGQRITEISKLHPRAISEAQLNLLGSHDTPRFRTVTGEDESAYRLATLFQMTYVGAPCIYYGDEIGLSGGPDPDCRRAFPWDQPETWNLETLEYTRRLAHARKASVALRRGDFKVLGAEGDTLIFERTFENSRAYVLFNVGTLSAVIHLPEMAAGRYRDVLENRTLERGALEVRDSSFTLLTLAPRSGKLLVMER